MNENTKHTPLVLLDAGGVILDGLATRVVTNRVAEIASVDPADVRSYYKEEINPFTSVGDQDEHWAYTQLADHFSVDLDHSELSELARVGTKPLAGIEDSLERVAEEAEIWILSNYIAEWLRTSLDHYGLDSHIDKMFISSETGFRKPNPEAFEEVRSARGDGLIIFVDDKQQNLDAAASSAGMDTVLSLDDPIQWSAEVLGKLAANKK